jgi:nucleotide-binding universal stress UspA family protein
MSMFKRILIATDGSELSRNAIATGVELASFARASIVGVHARAPIVVMMYGEASIMLPAEAQAALRERARAASRTYLAEIEAAARKADVPFEAVDVENESPADAILRTAEALKCDLIVMASHGRKGISRVLLGSESNKVLTHAAQPVLVTR